MLEIPPHIARRIRRALKQAGPYRACALADGTISIEPTWSISLDRRMEIATEIEALLNTLIALD